MNKIETKDKGDLGVAKLIAELAEKGIKVALPISEHLPFDLIAINENCKLSKISVKYRKIDKYGVIDVPLRTISHNAQGYKIKICNLDDIDCYAVYCPDNQQFYYIKTEILKKYKNGMKIRPVLKETKQAKYKHEINWGKDFQDINILFK